MKVVVVLVVVERGGIRVAETHVYTKCWEEGVVREPSILNHHKYTLPNVQFHACISAHRLPALLAVTPIHTWIAKRLA